MRLGIMCFFLKSLIFLNFIFSSMIHLASSFHVRKGRVLILVLWYCGLYFDPVISMAFVEKNVEKFSLFKIRHALTILAFYISIGILELAYQAYIKCILYIYNISSLLIILFALKLYIILGRIESSYPYIWSIHI